MNPFYAVKNYLFGILKALGAQLKVDTQAFLKSFVKDSLGKLAIDAVLLIQSAMPNADGTTKRDAAVAQLKADTKAAGYDVESFALSTLNWLVETALQSVLAS